MDSSKGKDSNTFNRALFWGFLIVRLTNIDAEQNELCPVLALPPHGFFLAGSCERQIGSLCGLGCMPGYRLTDGDSFRECQDDGTWTGQQPYCQEIHCPPLKFHTRVIQTCSPEQTSGSIWTVGTKCQAICNETGYRLIGPSVRQCLSLGYWSGYEQYCIAGPEIERITHSTSTTVAPSTSTHRKYLDYSSYLLLIKANETGMIISPFQSPQFTIVFWFYLKHGAKANLISLHGPSSRLQIIVQNNRVAVYDQSRNQTHTSTIQIPLWKWTHCAWSYSHQNRQSVFYVDGIRQSSIHFHALNFDLQKLTLFERTFHGMITRLDVWNEVIGEQPLLGSYRDCRKQRGNVFSWSNVPEQSSIDTKQLQSSSFCLGCTEPAKIPGGLYRVSGYEVGGTVDYECNYAYELLGASRAHCTVPSEWYPSPPLCRYNPCMTDCEICDGKKGICLRRQLLCDPPCEDDEVCMDGECAWSNLHHTPQPNVCSPSCPAGQQCVQGRCESISTSSCPAPCRSDQLCIDGRCGCSKGVCEYGRACYEHCEAGEQCYNRSCSCGTRGKCPQGETCRSDICACGLRTGGCRPHEHCVNGQCVCKTSSCDQCDNACQPNEICFEGKCVCKDQCTKVFCPFPCLNGGRCTGFYQCACRQGWQGHRCERRQDRSIAL